MTRPHLLSAALLLALSGCTEPTPAGGDSSARVGDAPGADAPFTVLSGWADPDENQEVTLPWTLEEVSAAIALGVVGEPLELEGRQLLRLKLTEILKGEAEAGELLPNDSMPFMGCNPPASIPRPSEQFPPGTEVTIYLARSEAGGFRLEQIVKGQADPKAVRSYLAFRAHLDGSPEAVAKALPPSTRLSYGHGWALFHSRKLQATLPLLWAILMDTLNEETPDPTHTNELSTALIHVDLAQLQAAIEPDALEAGLDRLRARDEPSYNGLARHFSGK